MISLLTCRKNSPPRALSPLRSPVYGIPGLLARSVCRRTRRGAATVGPPPVAHFDKNFRLAGLVR